MSDRDGDTASDRGFELYLDTSPGERRAALIDMDANGGGRLERLQIDRDSRPAFVETIFAARLTALDKQTGAGFLELGPAGQGMLAKTNKLTEGASVIVQVSREATGAKGVAVTRAWMVRERYLAWTAARKGISWAKSIGQGRTRAGLEQALQAALEQMDDPSLADGLSVRAPAVAVGQAALLADLKRLAARRDAVMQAGAQARPPQQLEAPLEMAMMAVRDAPAGTHVATDDRALFQRLKQRATTDWPDLVDGLAFSDPSRGAMFDLAGVSDLLEEALSRTVAIPGGGRLTIDRTEAMSVIDVDSGNSADGGGLKEEAVFRLNKRACEEAVRQIRLRNLSGLIVIDCVTLRAKGRMRALLEALRGLVKADPVTTDVLGVSAAGLIEITRQRTGPSLSEIMHRPALDPAPAADAQACAILRAALRLTGPGRPVAVASEGVERVLSGPLADARAECDRRLGRPLEIKRGPDSVPAHVELVRGEGTR